MHYEKPQQKIDRLCEGLETRLGASRFKLQPYEEGLIEYWVMSSYDKLCADQDMFGDLLQQQGKPATDITDYTALWLMMAQDMFGICRSVAAKKSMWGAIANVALEQGSSHITRNTASFLESRSEYMPADAVKRGISCFVGIYREHDYRLSTLTLAAQRLSRGDLPASEHVRQWLKSITLAPGVLPARKYGTGSTLGHPEMQENQRKWLDVVVPFCEHHPKEVLLSEHVFLDLPFKPQPELVLHCAAQLSQEHQQWLYANVIWSNTNSSELLNFWDKVLEKTTEEQHRDLRLHLAMTQLKNVDVHHFASSVDPQTVAVMDSLGTYSQKGLADLLYTRWLSPPHRTIELPTAWFDENEAGVGL